MAWEQLRAIAEQNRAYAEYWAAQPPRACPNDGTPLMQAGTGSGVLRCPHDGWEYPRDWDVTTMAGM